MIRIRAKKIGMPFPIISLTMWYNLMVDQQPLAKDSQETVPSSSFLINYKVKLSLSESLIELIKSSIMYCCWMRKPLLWKRKISNKTWYRGVWTLSKILREHTKISMMGKQLLMKSLHILHLNKRFNRITERAWASRNSSNNKQINFLNNSSIIIISYPTSRE